MDYETYKKEQEQSERWGSHGTLARMISLLKEQTSVEEIMKYTHDYTIEQWREIGTLLKKETKDMTL